MTPTDPISPDDSADLPPALLADLRRIDHSPAVPKSVDSAIRAHALGYFARQRRIELWTRWGSAVAAAIVVGIGLRFTLMDGNQRQLASEVAPAPAAIAHLAKEDIDRNGVVDVL